MSQNLPDNDIYHYFLYDPNWGANIFFVSLFGLITLAYIVRLWGKKNVFWLHSLTLMGALECSGYIARLDLMANPNNNAFLYEVIVLILTPNLLAYACYVILGKSITFVFVTRASTQLVVDNWLTRHPNWIPYFYVASDFFCLTVQAIGGSILASASTSSAVDTGRAVVLVGLAMQLGFVATFVFMIFYVWIMAPKVSPSASAELSKCFSMTLGLVSLLVVRNIYRTIEFATGSASTGYLAENEAWFLVFDSGLMALAILFPVVYDLTSRLSPDWLSPSAPSEKSPSAPSAKSLVTVSPQAVPLESVKTVAANIVTK